MNDMSKRKIIFYLVTLFLAGVVTGAVLTHQIGRQMMMKALRQDVMAEHWRRDLEKRLSLTSEQSKAISLVIMDGMSTFRSVLNEQMQTALSNCNARIADELTPEQNAEFNKIQREQQEFVHARFKDERTAAPGTVPQKSP